jgi:peptidoglycan/xylan/chitin deacetylase (PgdA/CDA1 family)
MGEKEAAIEPRARLLLPSPERIRLPSVPDWLPNGKRGAICFSLDDVHPSPELFDEAGDLNRHTLGHLRWLLERHEKLRATLFTTADWRQISPFPTRPLLSRTPFLRSRLHLAKILPADTNRLSRHPEFVRQLKALPRVEIGLHGLTHVRRGRDLPVEFDGLNKDECARILRQSMAIFEEAGLEYVSGMTPPGWEFSENLGRAMIEAGLRFVASARDIRTTASPGARTDMSGIKNVSLIYPQLILDGRLLHITSNFQATSPIDRAIEIIESGGLVSIKAHSLKNASGHIALDGLDELYRNYLDLLFARLEMIYGDSLWWTSMGQIADRCRNRAQLVGNLPKKQS